MVSTVQRDGVDADANVMIPPPGASMRQWDFNHLPLAEQLQALGEDATPPSFSTSYFLQKWARELPDAPCLLVPNATATAYITFSFAQYDAATNFIARHWASKLNPAWLDGGRTRALAALDAPVAFLAKDLSTSHFLMIAFQKLRIPLLLLSTRNSPAGVSHLVTTCKVSAILVEDSLRSLVEPQVAHIPTYSIPLIDPKELLQVPNAPPIPHCTDVDGEDVAVIVHSSGTTGFPKLVPTPYRSVYYSGVCSEITSGYIGRRNRSALLLVIPLFHTSGLRIMMSTIIGGQALVLPLSTTWPVSATQTADSLKQSNARILVSVPAIIEQLASNSSTHAALAGLHLLHYGGAPLSAETAQLLRKQMGIKLVNMYGTSECGLAMLGCFDADHGDFDSRGDELMIGPLTRAKMEEVDTNLYELVIHRDGVLMASHIETDENGWYHSGDLFQHRGKEHYVLVGRKDDTLVHVNGEKTAALPMENCLVGFEPVILRALVVGANRSCTAALIELNPEVAASLTQQEIDTRIANAVAQANVAAPQHSQLLYPDMVTVLPLGGPSLPTTDKGSLRRRQCNEVFAREIEVLYNVIDDSQASFQLTNSPTTIAKYSISELEEKLRELLIQLLPQRAAGLLKTDDKWSQLDFFSELSIDSLQATHIRGRIAKTFGFQLSAESVFTYSTIEQLAKLMVENRVLTTETTTTQATSELFTEAQNNRTTEYIRKFTDFSDITVTRGDIVPCEDEAGVLLTGATGSLGAWVLSALIQRPVDRVKTVFVLVRGGTDKAIERVRESLHERHCNVAAFDAALDAKRVVVLGNYDTNDVKFGQTAEVYERLEQEVSVIVHVAWSVGFNKPVQAYADQMFNVAQFFAAERILLEAHRQLGVPVKIVRVGQISGDRENGVWTNATEMNALLTYAPTTVHALPSSGMSKIIDWIPVDDVARALLEFSLDTPRTTSVYNLVNPKSISWSEFVNILRRALPTTHFDVQPYRQWVERLSKDLHSGENEETIKKRNPFFELIPFLQQSVASGIMDAEDKALVFMTVAAERDSSVIRRLPAIDDGLVRKYLRGWQRAGLIDSRVEIAE
ncbi:hypothetical protein BGX21_010140 [Mortierella sp. AD011]|nr:hypothetical protein BGX21_010140 [Mortierella sp. AD011]